MGRIIKLNPDPITNMQASPIAEMDKWTAIRNCSMYGGGIVEHDGKEISVPRCHGKTWTQKSITAGKIADKLCKS